MPIFGRDRNANRRCARPDELREPDCELRESGEGERILPGAIVATRESLATDPQAAFGIKRSVQSRRNIVTIGETRAEGFVI